MTMIEILAVILMIGLGLTVLASLLFQFARAVRADFEERAAREVASSIAEILDARGADDLVEGEQPMAVPLPSWRHLRNGRCTVTRATREDGSFDLSIAVDWRAFTDRDRRVALTSIVDRRKP